MVRNSFYYRGECYETQLELQSATQARLTTGRTQQDLLLGTVSPYQVHIMLGKRWVNLGFFSNWHHLDVFYNAETWRLEFDDPLEYADEHSDALNQITSPMPGAITHIPVKAGDSVSRGDVLIVMEAMKMEHSLKAGRDGFIESINVDVGDQVDAGTFVATLEPQTE
ncbi:MAG: biotin/lipoyl-binding protein [Gammaproteobacteria bacterium]